MQFGRTAAPASLLAALLITLAACQSSTPIIEPESPVVERQRATLVLVRPAQPSLASVALELKSQLSHRPIDLVELTPLDDVPERTLNRINAGDYQSAVAVGIQAGRALVGLEVEKRVFCQVFNFQDLAANGMAGVALLPPMGESLAAWKNLSPSLAKVVILTGPDQSGLAEDALSAGRHLGIEVLHQIVSSDQEYFQEFRRYAPAVDGLILVPDNRVLSTEIIRKVFDAAARRSVEVFAFTPTLLALGAVAVGQSDPADVAVQIVNLLEDPGLYQATVGRILGLSRIRVITAQPSPMDLKALDDGRD